MAGAGDGEGRREVGPAGLGPLPGRGGDRDDPVTQPGQQALSVPAIDLSQFMLPVTQPSEAEAAAHAAVLNELDKSSGGKTLWRNLVA